MNTLSQPQPPLTATEFYVLLALSRLENYIYRLKSEIFKDSLGSVICSTGYLYRLVTRLHDEGVIELTGNRPAGKSGALRMYYGISELGTIRLQEEYQRLSHALKIIEYAGVIKREIPTDIQRLLLTVSE